MPIKAEVDGLGILEFPDGTNPDVIKRTVKRQALLKQKSDAAAVGDEARQRLEGWIEPVETGLGRVSLNGLGRVTKAVAMDVLTRPLPGLPMGPSSTPSGGAEKPIGALASELSGQPIPEDIQKSMDASPVKRGLASVAEFAPTMLAGSVAPLAMSLAGGAKTWEETGGDPYESAKTALVFGVVPGVGAVGKTAGGEAATWLAKKGFESMAKPAAQTTARFLGSQGASQSFLLGDMMNSEAFRKATPEQRKDMLIEAGVANTAFMIPEVVHSIYGTPINEVTPSIPDRTAPSTTFKVIPSTFTDPLRQPAAMPQASRLVDSMEESAGLTLEDVVPGKLTVSDPNVKELPVMRPGESSPGSEPIPEDPKAIAEQVRLTLDPKSSKAATLVTPGAGMPEVPEGLDVAETPHNFVIYNPEKTTEAEVQQAASKTLFDGTLLGQAGDGSKPVEGTHVVTTHTEDARNVITEIVPRDDPNAVTAAIRAQQAAVPGGETEVKPAIEVARERLAANAQEKEVNPNGQESTGKAEVPKEEGVLQVASSAEGSPQETPAVDPVESWLDRAIAHTASKEAELRSENPVLSGAPPWLGYETANLVLRGVREVYRVTKDFAEAVRKVLSDPRVRGIQGFNENEAREWIESNVREEAGQLTRKDGPLLDDRGERIYRRDQTSMGVRSRGVKDTNREQTDAAFDFIDVTHGGDVNKAFDNLNSLRDNGTKVAVAGEVTLRAAEKLADSNAATRLEAQDLTMRAAQMLEDMGRQSGQNLQAFRPVKERMTPMSAVIQYLGIIQKAYEKAVGKKLPAKETVASVKEGISKAGKKAAKNVKEALDGDEPVIDEDALDAQFVEEIEKPDKVAKSIVDRLAELQARRAADMESRWNEIRKMIESHPAMKRLLRSVDKIDWNDLLQLSAKTQKERQVELFKKILDKPEFADLPMGDKLALSNALFKAWERERWNVFHNEFGRLVELPTVDKLATERLSRTLPDLVRWDNLGLLNELSFRREVAKEYGISHMDDATIRRLHELGQRSQEVPDGIIKSRIHQEMVHELMKAKGVDPLSLFGSFWFNNVLSGLKTLFDVGTGSFAAGLITVSQAAAETAFRYRQPRAAARMMAHFIGSLGDGIANAGHIIKTGDMTRLPAEQERIRNQLDGSERFDTLEAARRYGTGWKKAMGTISYSRRFMSAFDYMSSMGTRDSLVPWVALTHGDIEAFRLSQSRYDKAESKKAFDQASSEMGPGAKNQDIKTRQREILEKGIEEGLLEAATKLSEMTNLNEIPVGFGGVVYRAISHLPGFVKGPLGLSFIRSVINMTQQATNWAPGLGAVNWIRAKAGEHEYFQKLRDENPRHPFNFMALDVPPERRALIMASQMMGLALTSAAYALFIGNKDPNKKIEISGTWSGISPKQRGELLSLGERPTAVKLGDRWYSFRNMPFAAALAFVGNIRDRERFHGKALSKEETMDRFASAWISGLFYIKDVSAISQFSNAIGVSAYSTSDDISSANKWAASIFGNAATPLVVPVSSLMKEVDSWTDPSIYRPNSGIEYWMRNIPFVRRTVGVGPAIDFFGQPIQVMRTPTSRFMSKVNEDPDYMAAAKKASQGVFIPVPGKTAKIVDQDTGEQRTMTDREYYRYQKEAGQQWKDLISENLDEFNAMTAEEAAKWLKRNLTGVHRAARAAAQD